MKKTIVRIILVTFLLLASGATPVLADGTPVPVCWPGTPCMDKVLADSSPVPVCWPGTPCTIK